MTALVAALSQYLGEGQAPAAASPAGAPAVEEMLAAIMAKRNGRRQPPANAERAPRRCANCGEVHPELKCPFPEVPREMRPCWTCGKTGHSNADCPVRKAGAGTRAAGNGDSIKALEDIMQDLPSFCVTEE